MITNMQVEEVSHATENMNKQRKMIETQLTWTKD